MSAYSARNEKWEWTQPGLVVLLKREDLNATGQVARQQESCLRAVHGQERLHDGPHCLWMWTVPSSRGVLTDLRWTDKIMNVSQSAGAMSEPVDETRPADSNHATHMYLCLHMRPGKCVKRQQVLKTKTTSSGWKPHIYSSPPEKTIQPTTTAIKEPHTSTYTL